MDYIDELKKLNITFKNFDTTSINTIISNEYPFYKLMEYTSLFDKYRRTEKKDKYLNLDFEHLYVIAKIDEELSELIICEFLEIERTLKAKILTLKNELNLADTIINEYVKTDEEYLKKVYTPDNRQVLLKYSKNIDELSIEQFLEVVQFGTFERFNSYIYNKYTNYPFIYDDYILSAHSLRNKVAHCETILSQLQESINYGTKNIVTYLGQKGINHKTLTTNMSKPIIFDFCSMLYLYCSIEPEHKIENNYRKLQVFINNCKTYSYLFSKNPILVSAYKFMEKIVEIFRKKIT